MHGTILTDIEETVAGIKRQHNILAQLGIDVQKVYGYQVIEPSEAEMQRQFDELWRKVHAEWNGDADD